MNEPRATRYQRYQRRARRAGLVSGGLMLAALAWTPLGHALAGWAGALAAFAPWPFRHPVALAAFVGVVVLLWELAVLPAMLLARAEPGSRQARRAPLGEILAAQAQATMVAWPAALVAAACVRVSVEASAAWWWAAAGLLVAGALVAALQGAPALLARVSGARSVQRPALVEQLGVLARRIRVPIASIDELPASATASALVAGAGESRRVFVSAELVQDWSDDEIAVVVAHELAHHVHHDLWQTLALDAALLSLGFWAAERLLATPGEALSAGDLSVLPQVAAVVAVVWLALTPLRHAFSRRQERRADAFALELTGSADAFQTALKRLAARHLAEDRPSRLTRWFHHRHPTVIERLAFAERWKAGRSV